MIIDLNGNTINLNERETNFLIKILEDNLRFLDESKELLSYQGQKDEEMEESFPEQIFTDTEEMYVINNLQDYKEMFSKLSNIMKVPQKLYKGE